MRCQASSGTRPLTRVAHAAVVGGGNSTPIFAALAKQAGYRVAILTRRPADWTTDVGFVNEGASLVDDARALTVPKDPAYANGQSEFRAVVDIVTSDASKCIPQSDIIFLAGVPIHHNESILAALAKYVSKEKTVHIGSICAYGGFNWVASRALGPGKYNLFGTQLIPWTCGTIAYGKTGVVYGAKRMLRIAVSPPFSPRCLKN